MSNHQRRERERQRQRPVPTLDLHGFRLEPALSRLVEFLDLHQTSTVSTASTRPTVSVITGTGAHSHAGPVLRTAVESYLVRRGFQFQLVSGCFTIYTHSGVLTYQQQSSCEDTKVVIVTQPHSSLDNYSHPNKIKNMHPSKKQLKQLKGKSAVDDNNADTDTNGSGGSLAAGPTLQEVARDEAQLQRGKQESLTEFRARQKEVHQDERHLRSALTKSLLLLEENTNQIDDDDDEPWHRAIRESRELEELSEREENEDWHRAIRESRELEASEREEDDALFAQVLLATSTSEHQQHTAVYDDDDDDDLQRALALSISCCEQEQDEETESTTIILEEQLASESLLWSA